MTPEEMQAKIDALLKENDELRSSLIEANNNSQSNVSEWELAALRHIVRVYTGHESASSFAAASGHASLAEYIDACDL